MATASPDDPNGAKMMNSRATGFLLTRSRRSPLGRHTSLLKGPMQKMPIVYNDIPRNRCRYVDIGLQMLQDRELQDRGLQDRDIDVDMDIQIQV